MKFPLVLALSSVIVASPVISAAESAKIEITISAKGAVALDSQEVSMKELDRHLAKFGANEKKPDLLIVLEKDAPIKVASEVMDRCRTAGFTKFSLQSN